MKQWKGNKGLAGRAPCSWYIDENIVDIKKFQRRNQSSAAASPYQESPLAKKWWYAGCNRCHRMARASMSSYRTAYVTCCDHFCPSTDATLMYWFSVIASYRTGEAECTLFGSLAT